MPREITIPYNYSPRWYQLELLQAPQRFKIAVFHRRGGKSKTVFNEQVRKTQETVGIYYYFLPTYRQAKGVIWDELVKLHVPKEIVYKMNESELAIYYKNGSIQRFAGCEDIDKHRGINPIDVVFDEYSEENPEIWTAVIQPVLRENHGTATFIFTPKGKNHSWELVEFAKEHPEEWFVSIKNVEETDGLTEKEIEDARQSTPEALFRQEYYCDFLENAGAFFRNIKNCLYEADDSPHPSHFYQIGVDLAKYNDYTVITPFDLFTFRAKQQDRFNQVDWNFQKQLIQQKASKYNNGKIKIDRTGVGDPIVEDLERLGLNIGDDGAIVFSKQSRRELLDNLAILLQQGKIKIPNDPGLISELEAFQYVMTDKGKIDVKTRKGLHDDRVFSLALAVHGVTIPVENDWGKDAEELEQQEEQDKNFDKFAVI